MGLFRTVSEIDGDFGRKWQNFPTPVYFAPPLKRRKIDGVYTLEIGIGAGRQKLEWWGYRAEKEVWRYLKPSGYNTPTWQTDTVLQQRPRLRIAWRVKKRDDSMWSVLRGYVTASSSSIICTTYSVIDNPAPWPTTSSFAAVLNYWIKCHKCHM